MSEFPPKCPICASVFVGSWTRMDDGREFSNCRQCLSVWERKSEEVEIIFTGTGITKIVKAYAQGEMDKKIEAPLETELKKNPEKFCPKCGESNVIEQTERPEGRFFMCVDCKSIWEVKDGAVAAVVFDGPAYEAKQEEEQESVFHPDNEFWRPGRIPADVHAAAEILEENLEDLTKDGRISLSIRAKKMLKLFGVLRKFIEVPPELPRELQKEFYDSLDRYATSSAVFGDFHGREKALCDIEMVLSKIAKASAQWGKTQKSETESESPPKQEPNRKAFAMGPAPDGKASADDDGVAWGLLERIFPCSLSKEGGTEEVILRPEDEGLLDDIRVALAARKADAESKQEPRVGFIQVDMSKQVPLCRHGKVCGQGDHIFCQHEKRDAVYPLCKGFPCNLVTDADVNPEAKGTYVGQQVKEVDDIMSPLRRLLGLSELDMARITSKLPSELYVPLWVAIHQYVKACGGKTDSKGVMFPRMRAASEVEKVVTKIIRYSILTAKKVMDEVGMDDPADVPLTPDGKLDIERTGGPPCPVGDGWDWEEDLVGHTEEAIASGKRAAQVTPLAAYWFRKWNEEKNHIVPYDVKRAVKTLEMAAEMIAAGKAVDDIVVSGAVSEIGRYLKKIESPEKDGLKTEDTLSSSLANVAPNSVRVIVLRGGDPAGVHSVYDTDKIQIIEKDEDDPFITKILLSRGKKS